VRTHSSEPFKQRNPGLAALLGGVCIGAGLVYVGRRKTAAASILLALLLIWILFHYHNLWKLWALFALAVLWYWQMWYGYDVAENPNKRLSYRPGQE
jgi:hypothetical protein